MLIRLEEARKKKNMTQKNLAVRTGVSQAAICKFEAGQNNPSLDTLIRLANALDCSLDELVDRTETVS